MTRRVLSLLFVGLLPLMAAAVPARAVDRTYVGGAGDFLDPNQWLPVGAPATEDVAIINAGTATLDSDTIVAGLVMTGGTLNGSGTLGVTGPVEWRGGFMAGTGNTNAVGGLTIIADAALGLRDIRALNNFATASWTGTLDLSNSPTARLVNAATATFAIATSADFQNGAFINQGTLTKTAGEGDGETRFTGPLLNSGLVDIVSGSLDVSGGYANTTTGVTRLNGGTLNSSTPIAISGGRLQGRGSVSAAVVNAGVVAPGLPLGEIAIAGTYRQTSPGRFAVEIGGLAPGEFDRLAVSGTATLDGALAVRLDGDFVPEVGDSFEIMTFASRTGEFATTIGLPISLVGNLASGFRSILGDTNVLLQFGQEVCDDAQDNDGDARADCNDIKCAQFALCLPTPSVTPTGPTATPTDAITPPTATPTGEVTPPSPTPTGEVTPPSPTPTGELTPPSPTPTGEFTPPSPTPTGEFTPPSPTPTGELTPPSPTPTGEVTPPSPTPTGELTPPSATPTDDLTPAPTATATVTGIVSPPASPTGTASPSPTPTATPLPACVGDCDGNGAIIINELIQAVSISLGLAPLDICRAVDSSGNQAVEINELITAVGNALNGCPIA